MFLRNGVKLLLGYLVLSSGLLLAGEDVLYKGGDVELQGYVAHPKKVEGRVPLVIIVHQWKGLTDYEKGRAEQLAALGYVAFAVDIYGKGIRPADNGEAGKQAGKYKKDRALFRQRLNAGLAEALKQENVDSSKVVAIGYCFGGTGVIELARSGADISGVVSFHGGLDSPTPADGAKIKCKVLACHGADDPHVSAEDLAAFEKEMRENKVDWLLIKYGGAVHSFTQKMAGDDPSKGAAYNAKADERSWQHMKDFFADVLEN